MLTNCYLCNNPFTSKPSKEHLIPAALGGVPTSPNLLCGACNNGEASRIDAALNGQIGYLYDLVEQALPNTPVNALTVSYLDDGTRIEHRGELHPRIPVTIKIGELVVQLVTTKEEAKKDVRKKLVQLKGKFPQLDIEAALEKLVIKEFPEKLHYFSNGHSPTLSQVGDYSFFRAVKKIALNFYLVHGGETRYVRDVIEQVKHNQRAPTKISGFYYPTIRPVHQLQPQEVSHVIKLVGNPEWGVLYCYVELFNVHNALILLNDQYDGPSIDVQYCYDLLTRRRVEKEISLPVKHRAHLTDHFFIEHDTHARVAAAYHRTRGILHHLMRQKGSIK